MINNNTPFSKPYVIVIAGYVGSGKSTVAARLSKLLGNAPILTFDHYEKYIEWPQDMNRWLQNGADPDQIRIPRLKEDLLSLIQGKPVSDPFDGAILLPAQYILLEEPSGGLRGEIRELINQVVYIDVPQDLCVIRLVERLMDMGVWRSAGTFEGESKEDLARQLNAVAAWITHYQLARQMYMLGSQMAHQNAANVVDGMRTVDEIANDVLNAIKTRVNSK